MHPTFFLSLLLRTARMAQPMLALIAALLLCAPAQAHDPLVVEVEITIDGATLSVSVEVKQWALLSVVGERRSLFVDRAEFDRLQPRLAAYLASKLSLTASALPIPLAPVSDDMAGGAGELPDPLRFTFEGPTPTSGAELELVIDAFSEFGSTASIIDNVNVRGMRVETLSKTVKPGERIVLMLHAPRAPSVEPSAQASGSAWQFLRLGFLHILPEGLDHILFVLGLFLLAPKLKPLLTQITAFTIAHSITLGLAMAGVLSLPSRIVEPLIALSIAVVAIENIVSNLKPTRVRAWRWLVVFCFGLVHGLGFAGALRGMHLPPGGILAPLVCFNLGVEGGQLTVIALAAIATCWFWRKPWYVHRISIPASALIACVGLFWAIQRGFGYGSD